MLEIGIYSENHKEVILMPFEQNSFRLQQAEVSFAIEDLFPVLTSCPAEHRALQA